MRAPPAELLRCAPLFHELAEPPAPASPPRAPPPSEASPALSPAEKGAGCQCLPRCLSRLCRQRAGVRPCPPAAAAAAAAGVAAEGRRTPVRLQKAWERLADQADRRGQGDSQQRYTEVYRCGRRGLEVAGRPWLLLSGHLNIDEHRMAGWEDTFYNFPIFDHNTV